MGDTFMVTRVLVYITLLVFSLNNPVMSENQGVNAVLLEEIEVKTLRPFFNALKSGNVRQIEHYMTGEKLAESQLPKHEDKEYEEFLREYYRDAIFSVEQVTESGDQVIVDVVIEFPGRGRKVTQFYLQQHDLGLGKGNEVQVVTERRWGIIEQRHDPKQTR